MAYTIREVCKAFEENGIRYRIDKVNEKISFIYVDSEKYGIPEKHTRKFGFRPDFRISIPKDIFRDTFYVRDCGVVSYWELEDIIDYFKS